MSSLASNHTHRFSSPHVLSSHTIASKGASTTDSGESRPVTSSFVRDKEYYFDDGNVVLVADNVAFRVHKSILGRHSYVFHRIVLQQSESVSLEGTDYFDGCPVIRLPDRSLEVSELLRILYDHVQLYLDDLWQLTGLLRLSVKYQVNYVTEFVLSALSEAYPTTLSLYDEYRGSRPKCGDVVKLAHEIGIRSVLPCAYYEMCRYPMRIVSTFDLPSRVLEDFHRGRDHLASRLAMFIKSQILGNSSLVGDCKLPHACDDEWRHLKMEGQKMLLRPGSMMGFLPLSIMGIMVTFSYADAMCCACRRWLREAVEMERKKVWGSLSEVFNLGSWN